jgi:phosphate transport system permease protein
MASETLPRSPPGPLSMPRRSSIASWPLLDRAGYVLCWATGIGLCLIAAAIVLYMFLKGASYLNLSEFVSSPSPSLHQTQSGGFSDPIIGTLLSEYGRPAWLARAVESALEMMAGVPSVVLAIFGLLVFSESFLGFLSEKAFNGTVTGQSFITAGAVMSFLALPLVVASTREALAQLPDRLREASYALGKTRARTIRRVLLPAIRPSIASGVVLGMGRIIGDTAIITLILGATLKNEPADGTPLLGALRGTGSTLTSYVYNNSPAGEGNSHEKAYAAAFVLLMIVLALNALVTLLTGGGQPRERRRTGPFAIPRWLSWTR